jgi:hypothetical protein
MGAVCRVVRQAGVGKLSYSMPPGMVTSSSTWLGLGIGTRNDDDGMGENLLLPLALWHFKTCLGVIGHLAGDQPRSDILLMTRCILAQ